MELDEKHSLGFKSLDCPRSGVRLEGKDGARLGTRVGDSWGYFASRSPRAPRGAGLVRSVFAAFPSSTQLRGVRQHFTRFRAISPGDLARWNLILMNYMYVFYS